MKRIGVITLYHKSTNYGGNLQAYALCEALLKQGYEAEQICYSCEQGSKSIFKRLFSGGVAAFLQKCIRYAKRIVRYPFVCKEVKKLNFYSRRSVAFSHFNQNVIPHGEKVYNSTSISECVTHYDCFATGSDQVWNFDWYSSAYFLDFVPSSKTKFSYAASISMDALTDKQKDIFRKTGFEC